MEPRADAADADDGNEPIAAQAGFLRALSRGLLFDRAAADDVAQKAMLLALQREKRGSAAATSGFSLRAWLAGVVKNLARERGREEQRRAAREESAARPEALPSALETVARLELMQRLVAAVRGLDEPYRTTLLRRFFDGKKPGAIARELGVPVETVRTRLKRALALLRVELDARHGGERSAWGLLLLPTAVRGGGLLGSAGASVAFHALAVGGLGALAMSTKVKAVIGATATLLAGAALFWSVEKLSAPVRIDAPSTPRLALAEPATVDALAPPATGVADEPPLAATRTEDAGRAIVPIDTSLTFLLRGHTQVDGKPRGPLQVRARLFDGYETEGKPASEATLTSDEEGALTWRLPPPRGTFTVLAKGVEPGYHSFERRLLVIAGERAGPLDVELMALDTPIEGRVTDARGEPLPDATVSAWWGTIPDVPCDERGEFRLLVSKNLSEWELSAVAPGFAEVAETAVLTHDGRPARVDFRLVPDVRVHGRVRDAGGAPIAGAKLHLLGMVRGTTASGADGRYELRGLAPGSVQQEQLDASAPGFVTAVAMVSPGAMTGGDVERDFTLVRGARVEGVVLATDGTPVRGAEVWIGKHPHMVDTRRGWSHDDGSFAFADVGAGEQKIGAAKAKLPPVTTELVIPEGGELVSGVVVRFGAAHFLAGTVVDEAGHAVAGAYVSYGRSAWNFEVAMSADGDGRFRFDDMPADATHLLVSKDGFVMQDFHGVRLDRDDLVLKMVAGGRVGGLVVDDATGEPLDRFRIRFVRPQLEPGEWPGSGYESSWGDPGRTFTGTKGRWDSAGEAIAIGAIFGIEASAEGYAPAIAPRVLATRDADGSLVLRLARGARVTGQVLGPAGEPIAGALVTFATPEVPILPNQEVKRDVRWIQSTSASGAFTITGAPRGRATLLVQHADWVALVDGPFDVPANGDAAPRVIRLERGGAIDGVLIDDDGRPDAGRDVTLYPQSYQGPLAHVITVQTDGAGRFHFERLTAGEWQVSSQLRDGPQTVNDLTLKVNVAPPETTQIRLEPRGSGRITGTITPAGAGGRGFPESITVSATRLVEHATRGTIVRRGADAGSGNGSFVLRNLEPGTWRIEVSGYDSTRSTWQSASGEVVVADGATAEVTLRLAPTKD